MFIQIAGESVWDLNSFTDEEFELISTIRAGIQNELGEAEELLKKHKLKYEG